MKYLDPPNCISNYIYLVKKNEHEPEWTNGDEGHSPKSANTTLSSPHIIEISTLNFDHSHEAWRDLVVRWRYLFSLGRRAI